MTDVLSSNKKINVVSSVQQFGRTVLSVPNFVMNRYTANIIDNDDEGIANQDDDINGSGRSSSSSAASATPATSGPPDHILKRYKGRIDTGNDEDDEDDDDEKRRRMDQLLSSKTMLTAQKIGRTVLSVPDNLVKRYNGNVNNEQTPDADDCTTFAAATATATTISAADISRKKKHSLICRNLIQDQKGRIAVKELHDQCLQDMEVHLQWYLFDDDDNNKNKDNDMKSTTSTLTSTSYEHWIQSIHPENVIVNQNKTSENDHDDIDDDDNVNNNVNNNDNDNDNDVDENSNNRSSSSIEIDPRFYLDGSHHRQLWNGYMETLERTKSIVEARSMYCSSLVA